MIAFSFELVKTDGGARLARVATAHGEIDTPAFMPVGTGGAVKGMYPEEVAATGAQIILGNTYHLMVRPTAERVERLGGLRAMMNWPGPILTDSGGFQVMSLSGLRAMSEEGVTFRSHIDGAKVTLTPELSTRIQRRLGATISMAFDECVPYPSEKKDVAASMRLSMRWAARSRETFVPREGYGQFGVVQGGVHADLREESVEALLALDFDGYALGGLAVGEGRALMFAALEAATPMMRPDKPRYLMGVGAPADLVGAVARGVDMFDCVMPTRSGRTAKGFTRRGAVNLRNARHKDDPRPVDDACACPACARYSRAYLHHLFKAGEMLGPMLLTRHNLQYYQDLMRDMRAAISAGAFAAFKARFEAGQARGDIEPIVETHPQ